MKRILPLLMVFMLPAISQAAQPNCTLRDTEIKPDTSKKIRGNITHGPNVTTDDFFVDYTFRSHLHNRTENTTYVIAQARGSPNDYDLNVFYNDSHLCGATVHVPPVVNWTVSGQNFKDNISVGSSGKFGDIEINKTGNVPADLNISTTGNLTEYISHPEEQTIYNLQNITFEYQVPRDVSFGTYTANVTLAGEGKNITGPISTTFLDEIAPDVEQTDFPNYMATKPKNFTVTASDNLEVTNVTAEVIHEVEEEQNNETVVVNETYNTLQFEPQENSDDWVVNPAIDDIDNYYIQGSVCDESDNCDRFNSTFDVNGLDVIKVDENVEVPKYKVDSDHSYKIGEIQSATPLNISLDTFSRDLENSSFDVGITHGGSTQKFFADDKLVSLEDSGNVSIYVYSNEVGRFSGVLAYEPIPQHLSVSNSEFSGEFVNYTPPKDDSFDLAGKHYDCQAQASEVASEAYWDCSFKVYAENVEESLKEDMKTVIPRDYEQNFIDTKEEEVREANEKARFNFYFAIGSLIFGILSFVAFLLKGGMSLILPQKDSERRFG